jgi:hypothetical protein
MSEFLWSRHANPWSVWTAVVAFPLLVLALYRRSRLLLGGVLLFVPLNPLLFRPPSDDRAWATRVVLGEQVWLDRGVLPSKEAAMAAASAPVYLATFGAALRKSRWGTLGGIVLSMTLMLLFFARMVRLYDEQAATAPPGAAGVPLRSAGLRDGAHRPGDCTSRVTTAATWRLRALRTGRGRR